MEKDLPKILLLSHGEMCKGMVDSVQMLSGEADCIVPMPLKVGQDMEDYLKNVREAYHAMPEGSIILIDIMNGTPANCVAMLAREQTVYALTGVNLGMLLSAVFGRRNASGQELIASLEEDAHSGIVDLGKVFSQIERG